MALICTGVGNPLETGSSILYMHLPNPHWEMDRVEHKDLEALSTIPVWHSFDLVAWSIIPVGHSFRFFFQIWKPWWCIHWVKLSLLTYYPMLQCIALTTLLLPSIVSFLQSSCFSYYVQLFSEVCCCRPCIITPADGFSCTNSFTSMMHMTF
jgi:hypothetical protein